MTNDAAETTTTEATAKPKEVGAIIAIRTYVLADEGLYPHLSDEARKLPMKELTDFRDSCTGEELREMGQQACDALCALGTPTALKPEKKPAKS